MNYGQSFVTLSTGRSDQDHPKKKKCKKAKWLSEEAIQIAEERSEVNGKGERGRHNWMQSYRE